MEQNRFSDKQLAVINTAKDLIPYQMKNPVMVDPSSIVGTVGDKQQVSMLNLIIAMAVKEFDSLRDKVDFLNQDLSALKLTSQTELQVAREQLGLIKDLPSTIKRLETPGVTSQPKDYTRELEIILGEIRQIPKTKSMDHDLIERIWAKISEERPKSAAAERLDLLTKEAVDNREKVKTLALEVKQLKDATSRIEALVNSVGSAVQNLTNAASMTSNDTKQRLSQIAQMPLSSGAKVNHLVEWEPVFVALNPPYSS